MCHKLKVGGSTPPQPSTIATLMAMDFPEPLATLRRQRVRPTEQVTRAGDGPQ
jgi:hypothetical protein